MRGVAVGDAKGVQDGGSLVLEGNDHVKGFGQIENLPDGFEVRGISNIREGWPGRTVGMRVVNDLEIQGIRPHVFKGYGHLSSVHHEGDFSPLGGGEPLEMADLGDVEVRDLGALCRDDVCDLVMSGHVHLLPREQAAALLWRGAARFGDQVLENLLRDR